MVLKFLHAGQQRRHGHKEQTFGPSEGRRAWDDFWEWHWNIHITTGKTDSQWEFAVQCREPRAGALWQCDNLEGPGGGEVGRGYKRHMYTYGHFMLMCGRGHHNIVIILLLQRRQWHPTPVLLPGKSPGRRSLVGCSPWGLEESDMTDQLHFHFYALEKEMAIHSSVLAWRIPGMGLHRVERNWSDLAVVSSY